MKIIKLAVVASLFVFGAANVARAGIIEFELAANGIATINGADVETNATVTSQNPNLGFTSLESTITLDLGSGLDPVPFDGSLTIFGTNGNLFADVSGTLSGLLLPFSATSGSFVITGGTGIFAGAIGEGVFNSFTNNTTGATQIKVGGYFIPAPGALALLGLAGLAGRRRRPE